VRRLFVGFTRT